ncbi:hypothetical protein PsorP6_018656 [Peronosclerospora sorghi]|nr:hypothetical protein PsorP6_018676 [Peronosclerospora sorghi]KAI9895610.1 hypothetical protein PsorP6_018656 [Peronosclerospora sorghi]
MKANFRTDEVSCSFISPSFLQRKLQCVELFYIYMTWGITVDEARLLQTEGFGVITYDLLNHGTSDYDNFNTRAHISNFDDFVDDTNDLLSLPKARFTRLHYAGSLYAQRKKNQQQAQAAAAQQVAMGYSYSTLIRQRQLHLLQQQQHLQANNAEAVQQQMQQLRLHEKLMQQQMQQGQHVGHVAMLIKLSRVQLPI